MYVVITQTVVLLALSNVFMTFAWYGHLRSFSGSVWYTAAFFSWLIASVEYALQVPANRIGFTVMNVSQLKILQEAISLSVFIPIAVLYLGESIRWNYFAAMACILGAVYFIFQK